MVYDYHIGIDPSLNAVGVAIVDNAGLLRQTVVIKPDKIAKTVKQKLDSILFYLRNFLVMFDIQAMEERKRMVNVRIVIEYPYKYGRYHGNRNVRAEDLIKYSVAVGAIYGAVKRQFWNSKIDFYEAPSYQNKKGLKTKEKARKFLVEQGVISNDIKYTTHEIDAIMLAWASWKGLIEER